MNFWLLTNECDKISFKFSRFVVQPCKYLQKWLVWIYSWYWYLLIFSLHFVCERSFANEDKNHQLVSLNQYEKATCQLKMNLNETFSELFASFKIFPSLRRISYFQIVPLPLSCLLKGKIIQRLKKVWYNYTYCLKFYHVV